MEQQPKHSATSSGWVEPHAYPALSSLERGTARIRTELDAILAEAVWSPWGNSHYTPTFTRMSAGEIEDELARNRGHIGGDRIPGWKLYGLYLKRRPVGNAAQDCPETTTLVAEIPGMVNAGFSCLEAGYRLRPHVGHDPRLLRVHLGLIIPDGDCALRVDGEVRRWREGELLMFDDTHRHDAWNLTASNRLVLIVDVTRQGGVCG